LPLTRREALALGATAGVTAMTGIPGATLAAAIAAPGADPSPEYLRRRAYERRVGQPFVAGDHVLTLTAVGDVAGAHGRPELAGSDIAFSLEFDGVADALPSAIHVLEHAELGPFPLFLGPFGQAAGLRQRYGATIDRSVRLGPAPSSPRPTVDVTPDAKPREDAPAPAEPTARDVAIIADRRDAVRAARRRKALRGRRAQAKLRDAYGRRARFKRKQALARKRLRRARGGWLRRHGR
jgi:hypothetical protein